MVTTDGRLRKFVNLEDHQETLRGRHYYPEWIAPLAKSSINGKIGVALTRQGDILVFFDGTLQLTYRFGRWQFWNHTYLLTILQSLARAQRVQKKLLGKVTNAIYRTSLTVSFRRSGGLFVLLKNRNYVSKMVRPGDAIDDQVRLDTDQKLDQALPGETIQGLPVLLASEIAGLDGAVVLNNFGELVAYGAVLQPRKRGRLTGSEGSRTKAAIGASHYGLVVKISSDGDITIYYDGKKFVSI